MDDFGFRLRGGDESFKMGHVRGGSLVIGSIGSHRTHHVHAPILKLSSPPLNLIPKSSISSPASNIALECSFCVGAANASRNSKFLVFASAVGRIRPPRMKRRRNLRSLLLSLLLLRGVGLWRLWLGFDWSFVGNWVGA